MSSQSSPYREIQNSDKDLQLYAPRRPVNQLPLKYYMTDANRDPPLVHFGIPVTLGTLYKYALRNDIRRYFAHYPDIMCPTATAIAGAIHPGEYVQYELGLVSPFRPTTDSGMVLALYDNYTIGDKKLIDEDQDDVIQMVQEELGLDESVWPKWYFDVHDTWKPGDDELDY